MVLNCCLLLIQYQKQHLKTVEKLVALRFVDSFLPLKHAILRNYSMLDPDIVNNVPSNDLLLQSHRIVIYNLSQRILMVQWTSSETTPFFTKIFHAFVSLVIHKHLGLCFQWLFGQCTQYFT